MHRLHFRCGQPCAIILTHKLLLLKALREMDDDTVKRVIGDADLPSWMNFPGKHRGFDPQESPIKLHVYLCSASALHYRSAVFAQNGSLCL